jgi:TatD DNase family protein
LPGRLTFKNAANLRAALAVADPELILVETDAPFLTPHPHRGRPNASYMVPYTVRAMAELTNRDLASLGAGISQNTVRAYGKWD